MRVKIPVFLICIASVWLPFQASSQAPGNTSLAAQTGNSVSNALLPFMAQYKTTQVRTLPDGSTISDETTEVIAVDSQGRRMTAIAKTASPWTEPETHFSIYDPVAHIKISYISPGNEATVSAIPLGGDHGCPYMTFGIEGPTVKTTDEDLGTSTIQGVEAQGRRYSKTISLKPRGKTPTLLNMVEWWKAVDPGLGSLLVRYVSDDHSSRAKTTKELVSFRPGEPALLMFKLPSGYQVVSREVSPPDCPNLGDIEPLPLPAN